MSSLAESVQTRWHAFRQLGPRAGTATAVRHITRAGQGRLRAEVLKRRPISITDGDLTAALGTSAIDALGRVRRSLPSLERWIEELRTLSRAERVSLLARADGVVAHRFDLLGSGPTDLGPVIDWQRDFKTGRRWPLVHISRVPVTYPDGSDIKVPWELSRCQHLPLLAAAFRLTEDPRYLDEIGTQLRDWIASNPVEFGANWQCTMDVAIRAINWIATLAMCAEHVVDASWCREVLVSLLLHARFIRGHLESGVARGNHYLSDIVGLLVVAGLFASSDEGKRWIDWSTGELAREMDHQVRQDGCDHEASTSYHRLVAELFIIGADASDLLAPGALDRRVRDGIERMLQFVADYTRPDGLAPQIGDADDGRILPLGDYGIADQRSHLHLFRQAGSSYRRATRSAAYASGGFYVLRCDDLYAAVRCGDVGIYGRGCHSHNDLLGVEFAVGSTPIMVDPGSYLYTADPPARNLFRSTGMHSVMQVDSAEQNELRLDRLFAMVDRARPSVDRWEVTERETVLVGSHRGFEHIDPDLRYRRTVRLDGAAGILEIGDEVQSPRSHQLSMVLPLAPCDAVRSAGVVTARFGDVEIEIHAVGLDAVLESGWLSPGYGRRLPAPVVRLTGTSEPGTHRTQVRVAIQRPATSAESTIVSVVRGRVVGR